MSPQTAEASASVLPRPGDDATLRSTDLRRRAADGGVYLLVRQIVGTFVRSLGLLFLTRLIGPAAFGTYTVGLTVSAVLASVTRFGTDVYLVRYVGEDTREVEEQAFSFLLVASLILGVAAAVAASVVGAVTGDTAAIPVVVVMVLAMPINVLWVPAQGRLERGLHYRRLAMVELIGDIALYAVAIPLAVLGLDVWAAVAGYVAWQSSLLVASVVAAGFTPRWRWERHLRRDMLRHGSTYAPSFLALRLRDLVHPAVVGPPLGAAGIGRVSLALRLADNVGMVQRTMTRIALPTLVRVKDQRRRLERAHMEGMAIKAIGAGAPLLLVSLAGPWLIPVAFGSQWSALTTLLPLVAVSRLLDAPFSLHISVLQVFGRNNVVTVVRLASVAMLAVVTTMLVPWLGTDAFGWAAIAANLPLLYLDRAVRPFLQPRYGPVLRWLAALTPPMFIPVVGNPAALALLAPTVVLGSLPSSRRELATHARMLRDVLRRLRGRGDGR